MNRVALWILCLVLSAFAAEASETVPQADSAQVVQDSSANVSDSVSQVSSANIPLPRQSAYLAKGISVGVAGGIFRPSEDCDCLGVWQGQLEYYYSKWVSGGIDVRFFGGDLDSDVMVLYQRYRMNVRGHFQYKSFDVFLSSVLGLETTDLQEFRDEWDNREDEWWKPGMDLDSVVHQKDCEKLFKLDGFSGGVELGVGWKFTRLFGVTGDFLYEYNFSGAHLLTLSPGFAFSLKDVWPWANRTLASMWISVEATFQRYFNRGVPEWASSGFLGLQVGI